ncbi:MAG: hypothetical protein IH931_01860 [candidate division Zixibacteria bacterium]|nr:hypothetical protein [candidate division Zixibacteria bacterium]
MTEEKKNSETRKRITEKERFSFIGFDVFPNDPKELFDSDAEKEKLLAQVRAKHDKHDHLRESCTLLEERVSFTDRIAVTVGAVLVFAALFLPWYSVYNEIVEDTPVVQVVEEPLVTSDNPEEAAIEDGMADPAADAATEEAAADLSAAAVSEEVSSATEGTQADEAAEGGEAAADDGEPVYSPLTIIDEELDGELITSLVAKKSIHREYARLSGIGGIISFGSTGSYLFSSGISLILTVILFIVYTLLCVGLPAYTLYGLYGIKGSPDEQALVLKKLLRYNWLPLILFLTGFLFAFFGSEYGFDAAGAFTSLGDSYGIGAYLSVISPGVYVALAGSIICAAKGAEI